MSNVKLLPLPEWMKKTGVVPQTAIQEHARANVEHHTKALRAEVEAAKGRAAENLQRAADAEAYAEQLAEALREATVALDIAGRPGNAKRFRAALNAAQENDDA